MKFLHVKPWNLTIGAPPKCGSSSIHAALQREFGCANLVDCPEVNLVKRALVTGDVVFIVRYPLRRFKSLWRNKCRDKGKLAGHDGKLYGLTPDVLFDYVVAHDNHHWTPQAELLGDLKATLVPLENLNEWWAHATPTKQRFGMLTWNATVGDVPMSDELKRNVLEYYADDLVLHALARDGA